MVSIGTHPDERNLRKRWMTVESDFDRLVHYQRDVYLTPAKVVAQLLLAVMNLEGLTWNYFDLSRPVMQVVW